MDVEGDALAVTVGDGLTVTVTDVLVVLTQFGSELLTVSMWYVVVTPGVTTKGVVPKLVPPVAAV